MNPDGLKSLSKKVFQNPKNEEFQKEETRIISSLSSDDYGRVKEMTLEGVVGEKMDKEETYHHILDVFREQEKFLMRLDCENLMLIMK